MLSKEVQLNPGDVIGLGQHYLFLFKDPLASAHKERVRDSKVRAYLHVQSICYFFVSIQYKMTRFLILLLSMKFKKTGIILVSCFLTMFIFCNTTMVQVLLKVGY